MHWLAKLVLVIIGNSLALWLANLYVPGFVLNANWIGVAIIALVLSILNFIVKPVFTLILGPIIVLTLGLGVLVVNAIIIYFLPIVDNHLDILRGSISIETIPALIYTTLIVSAINFVIHLAT
jgi:putative membrane protein